jgi:hypothetical protein
LWGGAHKERKWDLVSWDYLCQPKILRGLGLRDLKTLNYILGAKTWWRWINQNDDLWAQIYHQIYENNIGPHEIIRLEGDILGSLIWNSTWNNKHIIHQHCFWEVIDGHHSLFWDDSW